jgi:hypothetical protein
MTEQLKVTSPEEYSAIIDRRGELVPLPSGIVVRAYRMDMEGAALKGGLPLSLVRAGQKLEKIQSEDVSDKDLEEGEQAMIFFREMTRKHCLEPRIVYETGDVLWEWPSGVRHEVDEADFSALSAWVRGEEVDELDSFRQPNRKTRRASSSQSRRKTLRTAAIDVAEEQPANA